MNLVNSYKKTDLSFIEKLSHIAEKNDKIDPGWYSTYCVKRGRREDDGKGVLVGLT